MSSGQSSSANHMFTVEGLGCTVYVRLRVQGLGSRHTGFELAILPTPGCRNSYSTLSKKRAL